MRRTKTALTANFFYYVFSRLTNTGRTQPARSSPAPCAHASAVAGTGENIPDTNIIFIIHGFGETVKSVGVFPFFCPHTNSYKINNFHL